MDGLAGMEPHLLNFSTANWNLRSATLQATYRSLRMHIANAKVSYP